MANPNAPHGFVPVRTKGGMGGIATNRYSLAAANGAIGIGDLVVVDTNGVVTGRAAAAAAAGTVLGVSADYKKASSGGTILVYDDPEIIFEAQSTTALTQAACMANMDITDATPTNSGSGLISAQVLSGTPATTASFPFKVLKLYPVAGNGFGANQRMEVCLNKSVLQGAGDGATAI